MRRKVVQNNPPKVKVVPRPSKVSGEGFGGSAGGEGGHVSRVSRASEEGFQGRGGGIGAYHCQTV